MLERGFAYVATGKRFKAEASRSCVSLKQQMPQAHATIYVDDADGLDGPFDAVEIIPNPANGFLDKIYAFRNSRYERTVFLDTDTYVCQPIEDLFDILGRFHIAAMRDHWEVVDKGCPACYDDFNTGVVAFRSCEMTERAFARWEEVYREQLARLSKDPGDQDSFRIATYECDGLMIHALPATYNVRLPFPVFLGVNATPRILHGRPKSFAQCVEVLGRTREFRIFLPSGGAVCRAEMGVIDKLRGVQGLTFRIPLWLACTSIRSIWWFWRRLGRGGE